jgi:hypothetical protein
MNIYYVAAIWLGMALIASIVSIKIAVPAALAEIVVGALAGNIPGLREHVIQTSVVVFLASVGSLVLTFLAGAEIDPVRPDPDRAATLPARRGRRRAGRSAGRRGRVDHPPPEPGGTVTSWPPRPRPAWLRPTPRLPCPSWLGAAPRWMTSPLACIGRTALEPRPVQNK